MEFTKRGHFVLWMCLIAANVILRLPSTPHEIGWDSFEIHILANSVSAFGEARWWVNPLSVGGFYPYSYSSAVPFILSGISQLTGIDMEWTIWLFCLIIGILSAFGAYLLAGAIWDNDAFKFLVAFGYSTSLGLLAFTTWTLSTRGFFTVIAPLFIYTLLKCRTSAIRYGIFTFILFVLLVLTHHLFYFTIPIILSYFIIAVFYKLKGFTHIKATIPTPLSENFVNIAMLIVFFVMLAMPFFIRTLWESDIELTRAGIASRYALILPLLSTYVRYIGILIFLAIGGYIYMALKRGKRFEEWVLLISTASLVPFLYMPTYMKWFAGLFGFLFIGIAITNIARIEIRANKKKYIAVLIVTILLVSTSFNGYYQFVHFQNKPLSYTQYRSMGEPTYVGGLWIKDYINVDKNIFWNNGLVGLRTFAISGVPTLFGGTIGQTYGFADVSELNITKNSPLSVAFYKDNPYVKTIGTPFTEGYINILSNYGIDHERGRLISDYNLSYVIEDRVAGYNAFTRSVQPVKDSVYDNERIRIWNLN